MYVSILQWLINLTSLLTVNLLAALDDGDITMEQINDSVTVLNEAYGPAGFVFTAPLNITKTRKLVASAACFDCTLTVYPSARPGSMK